MMVVWGRMDFLLQIWGKERGVPVAEKGRRKIKEEGLCTSRFDMVLILGG